MLFLKHQYFSFFFPKTRSKAFETSFLLQQSPSKLCEDCGGSGICAECNGEGFVLKKLTEESAVKARMAAKNMATRYTAGYA